MDVFDFCLCFFSQYSISSSTVQKLTTAKTAGRKKYKTKRKKNKNKHNKIVLLAKRKLNSIKYLSSTTLTDSHIRNDDFFCKNCVKIIL